MQISQHGHAALLVDTGTNRILFDPGIFDRSWMAIQALNAIIITHSHADHADIEGIAKLKDESPEIRIFAEAATASTLYDAGVVVTALRPGDEIAMGEDRIRGVGGTHACIHPDLEEIGNVGVVLSANGRRLFHPGDDISTVPTDIDILALPLSAPWCALKDTVDFLRAVSPARVIPIHDALLSEIGLKFFHSRIASLSPSGTEFLDGRHGKVITA
jgi:L-ascorbate metabolism protein UlaG (beta-lactamase superfamily)